MKKILLSSMFVFGTFFFSAQEAEATITAFTYADSIGSASSADRIAQSEIADFNGDSYKDILVTAEAGDTRLYMNDGTGHFSTYTTPVSGNNNLRYEAGDLDNDGDMDFVAYNFTATGRVYINNGSGVFTQLQNTTLMNGTGAISIAKIVDINQDGKKDIICGNYYYSSTDKTEIWLNTGTNGNAAFTFSTGLTQVSIGTRNSISVGDIDGDTDLDIVTGGASWNIAIYKNDGAGAFTQSTAPNSYGGGVYLNDWDKDGDLDLLNYDNYNNYGLRVKTNDGTGLFPMATEITLLTPGVNNFGVLGDVDNDGFIDFVCSNDGNLTAKTYINTGCALAVVNDGGYPKVTQGLRLADMNNDGKLDLFCHGRDYRSNIYFNTLAQGTPPALALITNTVPASRCGAGSVTLTATASNSGTIKWYNAASAGTLLATGASYTNSNLSATTTYYVDATSTGGCVSGRVAVTATINALPTVSVTGNNTICSGSSTTLTASGAATYVWSDAATTPTDLVSPSTTTTFTVTGTLNGCQGVGSRTVTVNQSPTVSITGNSSICSGASTNLTASGASTYSWNTGATTAGIAASPTTGTMYSVTGTSSNGCVGEASQFVVVNFAPELFISGDNVVCSGNSTTLTVSGASTYSWSDGTTTATDVVSPTTNTNYSVIGTSSAGCTASLQYPVTVNALPNVVINGNNNICIGNQAILVASGASSYVWTSGPTSDTNIVSPSTTTTYYVTGTGANGCSKTMSQMVTVNAIPTVTASASPATIGAGQTATLTANGASTYSWSNNASGSTISVTPSGTTSYTVIGTTSAGCSSSASVNVVVTASASSLSFDGVNDYVKIANPYRAFGNEITVEWWVNLGATIPTGCGIGQATENVDATATNVWLMHVNADRSIYWGVTPSTGTAGLALTSPLATGWHHVAGVVDAAGTRIYVDGVLSSTSGAGLTNGQTVNNNPNSVIHLGKDVRYATGRFMSGNIDEVRVWNRALCPTEISAHKGLQLTGAQNGLVEYYKFNEGAAAGNNASITTLDDNSGNSRNGTLNGFALSGTTSNWISSAGVSSTSSSLPLAITATIVKTDVTCNGAATGTATVTANGGCNLTYEWSNGATTAAVTGLAVGTYTCYISNASGSTKTMSVTISQGTAITTTQIITKPILASSATGAISLTVIGGTAPYTYSWSNNATTKDISGLMVGTYTVTITDSKGCTYVNSFVIDVASTKLTTANCGTTIATTTTVFWCDAVTNATNFEYEFKDVATLVVTTKQSQGPSCSMTLPTALQIYSKTYEVRVRAYIGTTWGTFGTTCLLSTPQVTIPFTQLRTAYCNTTLATSASGFWCDLVPSATNFEYEFTDVATSVVTLKQSQGPSTNMTLPVALRVNSKTYNVRVRAYVGSWGSFGGTTCQITTPATGRLMNPELMNSNMAEEAQLQSAVSVELFPNPANEVLNVNLSEMVNGTISIMDLSGRVIETFKTSTNFTSISTENIAAGTYFLNIQSDKGMANLKFVVAK